MKNMLDALFHDLNIELGMKLSSFGNDMKAQ